MQFLASEDRDTHYSSITNLYHWKKKSGWYIMILKNVSETKLKTYYVIYPTLLIHCSM